MKRAIAILCSDLHLRHTVPPARASEPDWYVAMGRVLAQLREAQRTHGGCPIVIAGDVLHKWDSWNSPAELVNWAMENIPPNVYTIPGQHDLPYHGMENIKRSAYWTLAKSGTILHMDSVTRPLTGSLPYLELHPFPWGSEVGLKARKKPSDTIRVAVVHAYIHKGPGTCHPKAREEDHISNYEDRLKGFDVAVFGDNHAPFTHQLKNGCCVLNSGGMMNVNSDSRGGHPGYSLLHSDGSVEVIPLDTSQDRWTDLDAAGLVAEESQIGRELLETLLDLSTTSLDYAQAVEETLQASPQRAAVARWLHKAMETTRT